MPRPSSERIEHDQHAAEQRSVYSQSSGIHALLAALDARDRYTSEHSQQVVALAVAVAERLGLPEETVREVEQIALLHDIGKVGIPDAILQKRGPLNEQEWELMRQHPVIGARVLEATSTLSHLAPAVRGEHERWDGAGYPDGLAGTEIPIASRITLACDAYHAMTSDRPYRDALSQSERRWPSWSCNAGSQFDPAVVSALLEIIPSQLAVVSH